MPFDVMETCQWAAMLFAVLLIVLLFCGCTWTWLLRFLEQNRQDYSSQANQLLDVESPAVVAADSASSRIKDARGKVADVVDHNDKAYRDHLNLKEACSDLTAYLRSVKDKIPKLEDGNLSDKLSLESSLAVFESLKQDHEEKARQLLATSSHSHLQGCRVPRQQPMSILLSLSLLHAPFSA